MNAPTEIQKSISRHIRRALEARITHALEISREDWPVLSIAEMLSLIFGLWGQTNSLGSF